MNDPEGVAITSKSERFKQLWQNPIFRQKMIVRRKEIYKDPLFIKKQSESHKKLLENPKVIKSIWQNARRKSLHYTEFNNCNFISTKEQAGQFYFFNIEELNLGKAGEYRVISELILRGFFPSLTCNDSRGVDIILENGKKIQVKTSQKSQHSPYGESESFVCKLTRGKYSKERNHNFDFLIFWIVPHNAFYIIPAKDITQNMTISINIKSEIYLDCKTSQKMCSKYLQYKNNWDLLK